MNKIEIPGGWSIGDKCMFSIQEAQFPYLPKRVVGKIVGYNEVENDIYIEYLGTVYKQNHTLQFGGISGVRSEVSNDKTVLKQIQDDVEKMLNEYVGKTNSSGSANSVCENLQKIIGDRYEVICDETNNPQEVIDRNEVVITVRTKR